MNPVHIIRFVYTQPFSPDLSDEDSDVLLAADAEARNCYVTKRHARTLERMRPCSRRIDLRGLAMSDEEGNLDEELDEIGEEEEEAEVRELLRVHVKRKKLRRKADVDDGVRTSFVLAHP